MPFLHTGPKPVKAGDLHKSVQLPADCGFIESGRFPDKRDTPVSLRAPLVPVYWGGSVVLLPTAGTINKFF